MLLYWHVLNCFLHWTSLVLWIYVHWLTIFASCHILAAGKCLRSSVFNPWRCLRASLVWVRFLGTRQIVPLRLQPIASSHISNFIRKFFLRLVCLLLKTEFILIFFLLQSYVPAFKSCNQRYFFLHLRLTELALKLFNMSHLLQLLNVRLQLLK
jgi:hypothetical protein